MTGRYLGLLTGKVWETVQAVGMDGEVKTLFTGIVTDFSVSVLNDQRKLTLELMTGSILMDEKKHFRSYQNPSVTYEQIFRETAAGYADSSVSFSKPYSEAPGELVLQYEETDWNFLKRLAGRSHQFLVPDSRMKGVRIYYSIPQGMPFEIPAGSRYTIRKDLGGYRNKICQGMAVSEADCMEYIIQCREAHRIGDYTSLYGMKCYIYKIQSRYEGGELLHCCYLKREKGIEVPEICNKEMAGCALDARITKVKEDKVQVSLLGDENAHQTINIWYPYATVYSTPDGTGWYCMPEIGDCVRLYIPEREEDSFVLSAVHKETDTARQDPDRKSFRTKYGKEILFTPETILLTNNQGMRLEMNDKEGITISSDKDVVIDAKDNLTISSANASLMIAAKDKVQVRQGSTSMTLDGDIYFTGGEFRIQ